MRLVAVNERTALYMVEDKLNEIDAMGFIATLLDIRNAKNLINMLIDFADTIAAYKSLQPKSRSWELEGVEPWFSVNSMRDAADTLRIRYQNGLNDAQGRFDSKTANEIANKLDGVKSMEDLRTILDSAKRYEVVAVNLDKLHDLRERWESLLMFAAIGNGATPPKMFITSKDEKANVFRIHHEAIEQAMPDGRYQLWQFFESHRDKTMKEIGHEYGSNLHVTFSRQTLLFNLVNVPNDPQLLLRLTCGRIAADGINAWSVGGGQYGTSNIWQEVVYDPDEGFHVSDQTDLIIDALRSVIVNNKVRLCPICGKPFIPKRKTKKYCSDVCKQQPYIAKKEGR